MTADLTKRMEGALSALHHDFGSLRTGRASANALDTVQVDAYGSLMPLNQMGNVTAPEPRLIVVSVWDKGMVKAVEKAIRESDMGLNPAVDGQTIRVPIPAPSEERRKEMVKIAHKLAENSKVAIRNIRRDGMDEVKKQQKDGKISEDEMHTQSDKIQKLTDDYVKKVDDQLAIKEKDILSV